MSLSLGSRGDMLKVLLTSAGTFTTFPFTLNWFSVRLEDSSERPTLVPKVCTLTHSNLVSL